MTLNDILRKFKNIDLILRYIQYLFLNFSDSDHIPNDSGLASSVDDSSEDKKVEKRLKKGNRKGSNRKIEDNNRPHQADLIFNLDF